MTRRKILNLLGGAASWPFTARAQQPTPLIGFLHNASFADARSEVFAFWQAMNHAGFNEHRNIKIDYRWAEGNYELLPLLAMDLLRQGVEVILAGGDSSASAAKRATGSTPIVFVSSIDPVSSGFAARLDHPGGNMTGVSVAFTDFLAKRLEFLHQLDPQLTNVTALLNPTDTNFAVQLQYLTDEATRIGAQIRIADASSKTDFEAIVNQIAQRRDTALLVANDGFLNSQQDRLISLTARYAILAAFGNREFVEAGGLMSYGPSLIAAYRQAGDYVGRILKGEKSYDLPIQHPVEFELVINLKTAKSMHLEIPPALLASVDDVIQ
jgi:putative ABC transport system substrate-binding protein